MRAIAGALLAQVRRRGAIGRGCDEQASCSIAAAAALAVSIVNAHAALTQLPAQNFPGTGLGAANTVLTLQNLGSFSFEAGSVGRAVSIAGTC